MKRFGKRKNRNTAPLVPFDADKQTAILKCSICKGEQVAGFKDNDTGKFHEVELIRSEADLQLFLQTYGISEIKKEY